MNKYKNAMEILEKIKNKIYNPKYKMDNRVSSKDFTRNRKMPFSSVVLFMLNMIKQTLQKELTHFMNLFHEKTNITKSAFSQSRVKLKPEAFIELNELLVTEFYTDNVINKWKDFRLLATDGSILQLPNSEEIITHFGCAKNNSQVILPMCKISTLYDVLNYIVVDSQIEHYKTSEYELAERHLIKTKQDDLLLYDRGYGAFWFFYELLSKKRNFVIRLQKSFLLKSDPFWQSKKMSKLVEISTCNDNLRKQLKLRRLQFKPLKIRYVKVILDTGEIELLATSLIDEEKFPDDIFKSLYFKRWPIETNYDHLKNNIQLENFSGLSVISIKQDFYANMFINNVQTIIARDAQKELTDKKIDNKYEYKINRNLSLGFMKDKIIEILMSNKSEYMEELKQLFKIEPIPIRKNRKNPREFHKLKSKYRMNHRRAI